MKPTGKRYHIYLLMTAMPLFLLILISFPDICMENAKNGLLLWFNSVLPALFPFFVISRLILASDMCPKAIRSYFPVISGIISGCPSGIYLLSEMTAADQMTRRKAQSFLILCGNASPPFLINYIACGVLAGRCGRYTILKCVLASSIIVFAYETIKDRVVHALEKGKVENNPTENESTKNTAVSNDSLKVSSYSVYTKTSFITILEQTIMKSAGILVLIGGYIILFSIISGITCYILPDSLPATVLASIPEMTVGAKLLSVTPHLKNMHIKSAAIAALCGFGGLSAIFQAYAPIRNAGLSMSKYLFEKIICAILCFVIYLLINHPEVL